MSVCKIIFHTLCTQNMSHLKQRKEGREGGRKKRERERRKAWPGGQDNICTEELC